MPWYIPCKLACLFFSYAGDVLDDPTKKLEDADSVVQQYHKVVVENIGGIIGITSALQNGQGIMYLLFTFGTVVTWMTELSGVKDDSGVSNSTRI